MAQEEEDENKKKKNIFRRIIDFFIRLFKGVKELLVDETAVDAFLESLGIDPESVDKEQLAEKKERFNEHFKTIEKYQTDTAAKVDQIVFAEALADLEALYYSLKEFFEVATGDNDELLPDAMTRAAVDIFTMNYFQLRHPGLHAMFELLGIMTEESVQVGKALDLLKNGFKGLFSFNTVEEVNQASDLIFTTLGVLGFAFFENVTTSYGWDPAPTPEGTEPSAADRISRRTFSVSIMPVFNAEEACPEDEPDIIVEGHPEIRSLLTASFVFVPEEEGGVAVLLGLNANETLIFSFEDNWELVLETDLPQFVLRIGNNGGADANTDLKVRATLQRNIDELAKPDPLILPILVAGLEIGGDFHVQISATAREFDLQLVAKDSALVLSGGEGDGFLKRVYPADAMRINFDLGIGWSNLKDFYFTGGEGLFVHLPIHRRFFKSVLVENISLGITTQEDDTTQKLRAEVSTRTGLRIGGFDATIDTIGLYGEWSTAKDTVNSPPVRDFDIGFLEPKGIGLLLDTDVLSGGGYLRLDYEKGEYAGFVELTTKSIAFKAVGILTTNLPDGAEGYSLLLLVTGESQTKHPPMGFRLKGIGGLIGINRSMNLEAIRKGVKSNTLDDILFPDNPIADAPRILATLGNTFPAADKHYVIGIMALISRGPADLLDIQLGVMMEFTELWPPDKLALIGVVKAQIIRDVKGKKLQILKLQVNFAGTIDFDRKYITFDASIYESKLLEFTLEGDLVFRMIYGGSDSNWLVSVGGFHPDYTPPPLDLPKMKRVKFLLRKSQPRLQVTAYLAVTSNSFQIGIRADLEYKKSKFKIKGYFDFDALLQTSPCYFTIGLAFGVSVSWGSTTLASIDFKGRLTGPTPWIIQGSLTFKVWIFSYTIPFCVPFGEEADTSLPDVQLLPLLREPLADRQSWQGETLPGRPVLVSLRDTRKDLFSEDDGGNDTGLILLSPAAGLVINQSVLPLALRIDRFAGRRPQGANRFSLELRDEGGNLLKSDELQDFFAPAQFLNMTDEEKLSRKSYEAFSSGIRVGGRDRLSSGHFVEQTTEYERKLVDTPDKAASDDPDLGESISIGTKPLPDGLFASWLHNNAVAESELGKPHRRRQAVTRPPVRLRSDEFVVVDAITSQPQSEQLFANQAKAEVALAELLAESPQLAGRLQVLSKVEID